MFLWANNLTCCFSLILSLDIYSKYLFKKVLFNLNNLKIEDLNSALKVLGYKLSDELLTYEPDKQKELIDKYVKAFAVQYDLEEFK